MELGVKWVVIKSYSYPYEAQIAKARLTSVGIPAMIENEHTINMNWLYSNALGGVKVAVTHDHMEDAKFLLEHDFSQDVDEEFDQSRKLCPKCNSALIEPFTQGKRSAFLLFAIIGFPLNKYVHGYRCQQCKTFFK